MQRKILDMPVSLHGEVFRLMKTTSQHHRIVGKYNYLNTFDWPWHILEEYIATHFLLLIYRRVIYLFLKIDRLYIRKNTAIQSIK